MPDLVPLSPDAAVAAVIRELGPPPTDGKYVAQPFGDTLLNAVSTQDAQDRGFPFVWAGGGWLVGPDGKVFALSSNPAMQDWDLAAKLLDRLYFEGLADRVEPIKFAERLRAITEESQAMEAQVIHDARGGSLRSSTRTLP